ncbi:tumor necrosis factor ligand superfamily member 10-like [Pelodytes ibericus]
MGTQEYYRTESSDSTTSMLRAEKRNESGLETEERGPVIKQPNPLWLLVTAGFICVLMVVSSIWLFVHFSTAISKLKVETQGMSEELRCLQIINTMSDHVEFDLDGLILKDSCHKLVNSIKSYVTQVTETAIQREKQHDFRKRNSTYGSGVLPSRGARAKSSAHLGLRPSYPTGEYDSQLSDVRFGKPHQSCRFPVQQWGDSGPLSHVQNMDYQDGRLKIPQDGKYYIYSQIYFRYPYNQGSSTSSTLGHQLVQCINKKTSYVDPILLLKGIGTKCWAPSAEYGLYSIHLGGLFELRAGDELFVSVSSLDMVYAEGSSASTFFGTFKVDL